jgi:hypothetical protein
VARQAEAGALSRLLSVTEALASVVGPDDVLDVLLREAGAVLGGRAALVYVPADGANLELAACNRGFEPSLPQGDEERESGWGLVLVERLASRWGVERGGRATFSLDLPIGM